MLTCAEYVEQGGPASDGSIWVNGLDLLDHCLQADPTQTLYRSSRIHQDVFNGLTDALGTPVETEEFQEVMLNSYDPKPAWQSFEDDGGDLNVERWLDGNENCFDNHQKVPYKNQAVTVAIDMAIPWIERCSGAMAERHKAVYEIVAKCEADRIPCQVVGVFGVKIKSDEHPVPLRIFSIIKDYHDPIFAGIWGAFVSNATTNDFINVVMEGFVGSRHYGNGTPWHTDLDEYMPDDFIYVVKAKRLSTTRGEML